MCSGSTVRQGGGLSVSLPLRRGGEVRIASIYPNNVCFGGCQSIRRMISLCFNLPKQLHPLILFDSVVLGK